MCAVVDDGEVVHCDLCSIGIAVVADTMEVVVCRAVSMDRSQTWVWKMNSGLLGPAAVHSIHSCKTHNRINII